MTRTQIYSAMKFSRMEARENRDATLEEVLHLVTDNWDEISLCLGREKGSSIANAPDIAWGGYFESIALPPCMVHLL